MVTNAGIVRFFIAWSCVSSVVILMLVKIGIRSELVFALRDFPVYMAMVIFWQRWLRHRNTVIAMCLLGAFTAYLVLNFSELNPGYPMPFANIRQLIAPVLLLCFFSELKLSSEEVDVASKSLARWVIVVFAFGSFEMAFEMWKRVGLASYFGLKGIPVDSSGVSFMFYEPLLAYRERMTSSFLDPISLGHFFATSFIFFFIFRHSQSGFRYRLALWLSMAGLFLCFSKGAMLEIAIALGILNPRAPVIVKVGLFVAALAVGYVLSDSAGVLIHLNGFVHSVTSLTAFGHGIGAVGNYAKMFGTDLETYHAIGISDTFVGAVLGQIGLLGAAVWIALMFIPLCRTRRGIWPAVILGSIIAVSCLSENTLNVTSFLAPSLIMALSLRKTEASV